MVILLNTGSCQGKGVNKWNNIKNTFANAQTKIITLQETDFEKNICTAISNGQTQFVAAGGDGTVNLLLNKLFQYLSREQLKNIELGAIGIGSSNDFHKPVRNCIDQVPVCIDFDNAYLRDVGLINFKTENGTASKYFIINASIGITAKANDLFNNPDTILRKLKETHTNSAILFAAIKTILTYKNFLAQVIFNGKIIETSITNLGIVKNPHFSGDFCYDTLWDYSSGKFDIHLAYNMNKFEVLNLMNALIHKNFSKLPNTKSWATESFTVKSDNEFIIEFDGETIKTCEANFTVLKQAIKVCK